MFFWMLRRKKPWVQRKRSRVSHTRGCVPATPREQGWPGASALEAGGQARCCLKPLAFTHLGRPDKVKKTVHLQGQPPPKMPVPASTRQADSRLPTTYYCHHSGFLPPGAKDLRAASESGRGADGTRWERGRALEPTSPGSEHRRKRPQKAIHRPAREVERHT